MKIAATKTTRLLGLSSGLLGLAALAASGVAHADTPTTGPGGWQQVALTSKPAVVQPFTGCTGSFLLQTKQGSKSYKVDYFTSGSGFFINPAGYIVTNAHVTELAHDPEKCRQLLQQRYIQLVAQDFQVNLAQLTPAQQQQFAQQVAQASQPQDFQSVHLVRLPNVNAELLPYDIKAYGAPTGEGKDVSIIKIEVRNAPVLSLGDSDKVQLQQPVQAVGFPGLVDSQHDLNQPVAVVSPKSDVEATFTDGRVSARKQSPDGAPLLQMSAVTNHGNSGGPVLNEQGDVVGITTFGPNVAPGMAQSEPGYSFAVPASTILEYVRQAGTTPDQSLSDAAYRAGLGLYWGKHYSAALVKFQETQRLFAAHSEAARLERECQEAVTRGEDVPVAGKAPSGTAGQTPAQAQPGATPVSGTGSTQPAVLLAGAQQWLRGEGHGTAPTAATAAPKTESGTSSTTPLLLGAGSAVLTVLGGVAAYLKRRRG